MHSPENGSAQHRPGQTVLLLYMALFSSSKILQNFSDSPSHQIFRRIHEVLNIDENKN